jgi:uncharacterized membrane protein YfcA
VTTTATRPNAAIAGVTGAAGGFLSGILGGGGGAIMVPLMTGPMKLRQHIAHGTSLVVIIVTAAVAAAAYALHEPISGRLVLALLAGAVIGAALGARAAMRIPALRLRQVFGLFLVTVSLRLLLVETIDPLLDIGGLAELLAGAAIGLVGGLASGALGVGGGAIFVPALVLVLGVGQHEAQGISLWVIVGASLMGALAHYRQGTVDTKVAKWVAPFALPGAIAGALAASALSGRALQVIFAVVLTAIGVQMLVTAQLRLRAERSALAGEPVAGEAA